MIFKESLPSIEELKKSPENFAKFITEKICGDKWIRELPDSDNEYITEIIKKFSESEINYKQFNEILLLINQDIISEDFFKFCFEADKITFEKLIGGVKKIRGFYMLSFGNFRYPYKSFGKYTGADLNNVFSPYNEPFERKLESYKKRPEKMLEIEKIEREKTWLLGYISGALLDKESSKLDKEMGKETPHDGEYTLEELENLGYFFKELENTLIECRKKGLKNTDKYLTWDYLDVYVATSMRNNWEFEQVSDFIEDLSGQEVLRELKLRFFDPTQSYCGNPRDKGLVEGLMIKRASCTIYLAQESDTMGKDSELASSLAQGKPVIAYIPQPDPEEYARIIQTYPLEFIKKRFVSLEANERFDDEKVIENLQGKFGDEYEEYIDDFLVKLSEHRKKQPYTFWKEKDEEFRDGFEKYETLCAVLSEVECYHYDKRAETIKKKHPLSMQVVLETGVANGVLVVRKPNECADLLHAILTNNMEFKIETITLPKENELGIVESYTVLIEKISESPYRIVTHQERLTNSFWNNFWQIG